MDTAPQNPQTADDLASRSDVTCRPELQSDEPFLFEVYASTREEELALTNWDAATRTAFLTHQFKAMRSGYRSMFPSADFLVILKDGNPVGRMVINRESGSFRVVDLALTPAARGHGIGSCLMRRLQLEAGKIGKPIQLQVFQTSRAINLYQRLGFNNTGEDGPYRHMQWTPAGQ